MVTLQLYIHNIRTKSKYISFVSFPNFIFSLFLLTGFSRIKYNGTSGKIPRLYDYLLLHAILTNLIKLLRLHLHSQKI